MGRLEINTNIALPKGTEDLFDDIVPDLVDFLIRDFGFSQQEVHIYFSGHRGYHVTVESGEIQALDSMARKEIVDYVLGVGLEPRFHGLTRLGGGGGIPTGPDLYDEGWRGRIAMGTYEVLLTADLEELLGMGLSRKKAEAIISNRDALLESWRVGGPWGVLRDVGSQTWRRIARQAVRRCSAQVDTVVTTDIHRLIRLNRTLHGKTGLRKVEVPHSEIDGFDPLREAVAFRRGTVKVFVDDAPKFRVGDEYYGPYRGVEVELPTAAALMLLCKGAAQLVT